MRWGERFVRSASAMTRAAEALLGALDHEQRGRILFAFEDPERFDWSYVPRKRRGLALREMTPAPQDLACALLRASLSERGYQKATQIRELELVLRDIERGRAQERDPGLYSFSIFGSPSAVSPWGLRVEGHHLVLYFTIIEGRMIATTPTFFGANPAEVMHGPQQGRRVLQAEEDLARTLLHALDAAQQAQALFDTDAPSDILTGHTDSAIRLAPAGVLASELDRHQRSLLKGLIREHASAVPPQLAAGRLRKLREAGFDKIQFAWAGGLTRGEPHYYRVQGPTFLIEYDNTQNQANHAHSVWRDFDGDYGRDLLAEHYRAMPHDR